MAEVKAVKKEKEKNFRWTDDDIDILIDLFEERPCLWDISSKSYQKREVKERAFNEISEALNVDVFCYLLFASESKKVIA